MLRSREELEFLEDNKDKVFYFFAYAELSKKHPLSYEYIERFAGYKYLGKATTHNEYILYKDDKIVFMSDMVEYGKVEGDLYEVDATIFLSIKKYMERYDFKEIDVLINDSNDISTRAYTNIMSIILKSGNIISKNSKGIVRI